MKKKKLIGLGVFALAFAAVAGAVSAQSAVEARAADPVAVYFRDAAWWNTDSAAVQIWAAPEAGEGKNFNMEKVETGTTNVWKAEIDVTAYKDFYFKRVSPDYGTPWGAETVAVAVSGYTAAKPMYDISATEAAWGESKVTGGAWAAYEAPAPVETAYYVVGTFNKWTTSESCKMTQTGDVYKLSELKLEKDVQLKVTDGGSGWWPVANVVVPENGEYTVEFNPTGAGQVTLTKDGPYEPVPVEVNYYLVGDFNKWAEEDVNYIFEKMGEEKDHKDQYKLGDVTLEKDQKLKVMNNKGNWYPDGESTDYVVAATGIYDIYFVPAGGISDEGWYHGYYYLNKTGDAPETPTDYFLTGSFNSWAEDDANYKLAKMEAKKGDKDQYEITNVELTVGDKVKVVSSKGTWYPAGSGNDYEIAETAEYNVYFVPEGGVEDEGWHAGFFYVANVDRVAVRNFVNDYITEQAKPSEVPAGTPAAAALCKAKYEAAKAAYDVLSDEQKALFNTDEEFKDAKAAYSVWEAAQAKAAARNSGVMADNGTTIAIISIVSAGVLAVGAMAYFARKRKAN